MPVHYERRGPIATFTFDHGKVNALTPQMHKELYHHLQEFLRDQELRVGILTGAEGKCFSAGDDIKTPMPPRTKAEDLQAHLNPHGGEGDTPGRPGWDVDILMLPRYKPIVGAVRSWCLGQALMYLLLHTDVRIEMEAYYRGIDMARQDAVINAGHLYRLQRLGYEGYGAESGFFGKKAPRS